ncbi:hypothetical protein [Sporosarcina psychrophila]|uniref:Uncharacterized protein n=1 Tax=Sporosarcina psychrophila TaxID=1476 RepID=A0ABV2KAT3_SPOPS
MCVDYDWLARVYARSYAVYDRLQGYARSCVVYDWLQGYMLVRVGFMIGSQGYMLGYASIMIGWRKYMLGCVFTFDLTRHRFAILKLRLRTSLRLFCFFFAQRLVQ